MRYSPRFRSFLVCAFATLALTAMAPPALAQYGHVGVSVAVPVSRQVVVSGGIGFGYPLHPYHPYPYYRPYYPYYPFYPSVYFGAYWNPWYWGGPYPYYPYAYAYPYDPVTASLRLDMPQKSAQVYVDGYLAGRVDDFDGYYQRLRLRPGTHEISVYQDGYRTSSQNMYLGVGSDQKVKQSLDPLAPGETTGPPPQPDPDAVRADQPGPDRQGPPSRQRPPSRTPPDRPQPEEPAQRPEPQEPVANYGTLALRMQPADANLFIDGERWTTTGTEDRLTIRLSEGRHHIEVRKAGYAGYSEDLLIRRNATMTLNLALTRN